MAGICKYCGFAGTNDAMAEHAGEMCQERLNQVDLFVIKRKTQISDQEYLIDEDGEFIYWGRKQGGHD